MYIFLYPMGYNIVLAHFVVDFPGKQVMRGSDVNNVLEKAKVNNPLMNWLPVIFIIIFCLMIARNNNFLADQMAQDYTSYQAAASNGNIATVINLPADHHTLRGHGGRTVCQGGETYVFLAQGSALQHELEEHVANPVCTDNLLTNMRNLNKQDKKWW